MQDKGIKKPKRKYGKIKKNFVSVEDAEEEKAKNAQVIEQKLKNLNLLKSLKVDTPWTTGSSDEGNNGYLYYRIQQAKKKIATNSKYDSINEFLDQTGIVQIDFSGMLKESKLGKDNLFKKVQEMSEKQANGKTSSLLMRRKLMQLPS